MQNLAPRIPKTHEANHITITSLSSRSDNVLLPESVVICPECDLLLETATTRRLKTCPRCQGQLPTALSQEQAQSRQRLAFWLAIAGLMLAIPALSLPLATLTLAGMSRHCTLLSGVEILWQQGHMLVASLVFITSVFAPILILSATVILTFLLHLQRLPFQALTFFRHHPGWMRYLLKLHEHATEWGMLDVYLLSLLVAYIKLIDYGHVTLGLGLLCYLLVMLLNIMILRQFTSRIAWQLWHHAQKKPESSSHSP